LTDENDSEELEDRLVEILHESGFTVVPMQTVIDALAEMENYLKEQAGITQEELEVFLHKIENLIGKEESFKLDLDEILSWIKTFQSF
jgi:hypothetical protein